MTTSRQLFVGPVRRTGDSSATSWPTSAAVRVLGSAAETGMAVFLAIFGTWALRGAATACVEVIVSAGSHPVGAVILSVFALVLPAVLAVFGAITVHRDGGTVSRMVGFAVATVVAAGLTEWFLLIWAALLFG